MTAYVSSSVGILWSIRSSSQRAWQSSVTKRCGTNHGHRNERASGTERQGTWAAQYWHFYNTNREHGDCLRDDTNPSRIDTYERNNTQRKSATRSTALPTKRTVGTHREDLTTAKSVNAVSGLTETTTALRDARYVVRNDNCYEVRVRMLDKKI